MGPFDLGMWVSIGGMITGTLITALIILPIWQYVKGQHEIKKINAQRVQADPKADEKARKLHERVENLETIVCNLDREMNVQLEKSLSGGKLVTVLDATEGSQMPTAFMNVASTLESRYQILKELGRGGMGIVFQAHDKALREQVAIKILSPLLSNNPEALERMKREVSAARRITHPNVIRIHDIAEIGGLNYVSMEYFQGTNLKEFLKKTGSLSLMQAFEIAGQICDGLEAAHRQGVIHRDLKSQNIIINNANQIKIIDFGLAHSTHFEGMTATGLIMGTPEYMAPEQVEGKRVDERADIYSLGIILYELFTGRVPFTGDSAIAVGFKQLKEDPLPPRKIAPHLPAEIEAVILKCLQKIPSSRYASLAELKAHIHQISERPAAPALQSEISVREKMEQVKS